MRKRRGDIHCGNSVKYAETEFKETFSQALMPCCEGSLEATPCPKGGGELLSGVEDRVLAERSDR